MRRRLAIPCFLICFLSFAQTPKPTGQLIKAGGRNFHLVCSGTGNPTVILLSGIAEFSTDWTPALSAIARGTRVCAWDRAGYAWSDMSPGFEQFPEAAGDLHRVMQAAGIIPPYVLAGHAMGALYARDYQRLYPSEVGGLVLVDPTPEEDFQAVMSGNTVSLIDMADHDLRAWPVRPFAPGRTSPPPPAKSTGIEPPFDSLPRAIQAARQWALRKFVRELNGLNAEQGLAIMESERAAFIELYSARHAARVKTPAIVLSRGRDSTAAIAGMQDEVAKFSTDTVHRVVPDSGTQIQIEQPEAVASAVMEVVQSVRSGKGLK
jgi:pimeloyl-ACP methyl ester carboxylesterase